MFRSLVVGLGRAGSRLHLRVLAKARATRKDLFHPGPVLAYDPAAHARAVPEGVSTVESLQSAAKLVDPDHTVAHVCTPPNRAAVLAELAENGFRRLIVEKPLATGVQDLRVISHIRRRHGLDIAVVSHWLDAELTHRIGALVRGGELGPLRAISFALHKPRFTRTATTDGHPTAFDVEVPHSLGVALRLAGSARVTEAEWTDMRFGNHLHPRMGGARMVLRHDTGVISEITSDLTAPVRQRRIELEFARGSIIGHYPLSEDDDHAHLVVAGQRQVFQDDALTRFMLRSYDRFRGTESTRGTYDLHCAIVGLLDAAKALCASTSNPLPDEGTAHAR